MPPPPASPRKLLIVKPSAFGDVIQALPVAASLKAYWPEAEVHWVVNESYAPLLEGHAYIDHLVRHPRRRWNGPCALPEIVAWCGQLRRGQYDLTLDLQGLLRSGLMTAATRAPRRVGLASAREGSRFFYNEVVQDNQPAAADRYLGVARHLGAEPKPLEFGLHAPESPPGGLTPGGYVVAHPYSRWRTKLWPWRYYDEVARGLAKEGLTLALIGQGPWFPVQAPGVVDLRNGLSLTELMAVLAHARCVLSTDSGPAHLAGALGVETLVLFGPTDWRRTKPVGRCVDVIASDLNCSPCLKRRCPRDHPVECLEKIQPEMVNKKILSKIFHSSPIR